MSRRIDPSRSKPLRGAPLAVWAMLIVFGCGPSAGVPSARDSVAPAPIATESSIPASPTAPATQATIQESLDKIIASTADATDAGVSAAVIGPSWSWEGATGAADTESGRPVTSDTSFALASVTKPVVAALALRLAEQGVLDLDAPIEQYLPDDIEVDTNGATVRQALAHRSGIGEHTTDPGFFEDVTRDPDRIWSAHEIVARAAPPSFEAGHGWQYSNTNYLLVAMAIEKATGEPLGTVLRRELLDRADVDGLVYQPDEPPHEPLAVGRTSLDGSATGEPITGGGLLPTRAFATAAGGAGGMAADAPSLARLGAALFGGDLLSADSLDQMLAFEDAEGGAYGLGTARIALRDGTTAVGHDGLIPGFASALLHVPGEDLTAAVLVNADNPGSLGDPMGLARRLLAAARRE